ncbi:MAG: hypothetical protein FWG10_12145 [Eubacteriaceae bacterium]|nr:hypothetical protein [Eubacteriaceae bacterium]
MDIIYIIDLIRANIFYAILALFTFISLIISIISLLALQKAKKQGIEAALAPSNAVTKLRYESLQQHFKTVEALDFTSKRMPEPSAGAMAEASQRTQENYRNLFDVFAKTKHLLDSDISQTLSEAFEEIDTLAAELTMSIIFNNQDRDEALELTQERIKKMLLLEIQFCQKYTQQIENLAEALTT